MNILKKKKNELKKENFDKYKQRKNKITTAMVLITTFFMVSIGFSIDANLDLNRSEDNIDCNINYSAPLFVSPMDGVSWDNYIPDVIEPPKYKQSLQDILSKNRIPPSPTGNRELLVILVEFSDVTASAAHDDVFFENLLWGTRPSLQDYFTEVSYGQFTYIPGQVLDPGADDTAPFWYANPHTQSWGASNVRSLASWAITQADADFDFSPYDANSDGTVTNDELTIFVVCAGTAGDMNGAGPWSHHWRTSTPIVTGDGVNVEGEYSMTCENNPMGTYAHELGHDLGLPDLYDTDDSDGDSNGIGHYGLMGSGSWCGPTHMTAWSKIQLGWLTPTVINANGFYDVHDVETNAEAFILYNISHSLSEYFLIENRWKGTSYDNINGLEGDLDDQGILIYHIDDEQAQDWWNFGFNNVNTDETHKGVDVECADSPTSHVANADDLDAEINRGDSTDLWDINEYDFVDSSTPCDANWYGGIPSGCDVTDFPVASATMNVHLSTPYALNIAVSEPGYDRMQETLDSLGWGYTEINNDILSDYSQIQSFDIIFINCKSGLEVEAAEAATSGSLAQFVNDGGFLYVSDWAYTFIEHCLPGYLTFIGKVGNSQTTNADILDAGLAAFLGSNTIDLNFDLGAWVVIDTITSGTTVYVEGDVSWTSGSGIKPIVIGFDHGDGRVIFASFHHRAQGTEAANLMIYLALTGITQNLAEELEDSLESEGYEMKQDIRGLAETSESYTYTYNAVEGENMKFMLNWLGSTMNLSVYDPDGTLFMGIESDTPPISIEVPYAKSEYSYVITAVDIPYDNYPFACCVGSKDKLPPTTILSIGNPKYLHYITSHTSINITATDLGGSGVKEICYNYGAGWISDPSDFTSFYIPTDGFHTVQYYGIDNAGNIESIKNITVFVDNIPPITDVYVDFDLQWAADPETGIIKVKPIVHCVVLTSDDGLGSNHCIIKYLAYNEELEVWQWHEHPSPLLFKDNTIPKISCFYSVDILGNEEKGHEVDWGITLIQQYNYVFNRGFPIRNAADGAWSGSQSFIPEEDTLSRVNVLMRKFGDPEFDLTVEIRKEGVDGPLIHTETYPREEMDSNWDWITLDLEDVSVNNGDEYFIVIPAAPYEVTTSFGYEWGYAYGNQYDMGAFWFTRDGGNLWRDLPSMYEFVFNTYEYS